MQQQSVTFDSAGLQLAGTLYLPDNFDGGKPPAIVVSHPGSAVKEQSAGLYARHLAEQGFVTLAFDAAYGGESEGEPRGLEDPAHRVEDIKAAISFLSARDGIDADRLGLLGICASGGYSVLAAATDHRIKAVATVSGTDIGRFFREGYDGKQPSLVLQALLDNAARSRTAEARGDGVQRFPIFPATEADARQAGQYVYEGWEYYCTPRAAHPRSTKAMPWRSADLIATFNGFSLVHLISPRPLLMIAGTQADTRWMSEEAFSQAAEPKTLHWIDGASHVDLYDKAEYVVPAVRKLAAFYTDELSE
uniref:alpha/beta hydrolase n=1 Tax=Burkholderia anthina TaxID=179879 RepID=UPI00158AA361|nr:alpha/beta hydrolase [Burkholderia anthina]